jgi:hypothetical protein
MLDMWFVGVVVFSRGGVFGESGTARLARIGFLRCRLGRRSRAIMVLLSKMEAASPGCSDVIS